MLHNSNTAERCLTVVLNNSNAETLQTGWKASLDWTFNAAFRQILG